MRRLFTGAIVAALAVMAYPQPARPSFDIASVKVSPRATWVKTGANAMQGGFLLGDRYELHRATMVDLIRLAYSIDADKIYAGPSWLDYDRFDVSAKTAADTRPAALRLMLQSLLEDRFKLSVKPDTKPLPAVVLSVIKDRSKLKPAEREGTGCQQPPLQMGGGTPTQSIQCRGVTMDEFASALNRLAANYFDNLPVVNSTGIDGIFDIDLKFPARVVSFSVRANTAEDSGTAGIFDAVEKDLGLKLTRGTAPQPVLNVLSVNEQPTPDPGATVALPPLLVPHFEVAAIRQCEAGTSGPSIAPRFETGGRVTMRCMPIVTVLTQAFNLAPSDRPVDLPKWTDDPGPSHNFTLEAKAPEGAYPDAANAQQGRELLDQMLRGLLEDRFKLAAHFEDRPMDAMTLVATKPKLAKAADPSARTGCTRQNQPGFVTLKVVCQNITMAQFAEQIPAFNVTLAYPVLDSTGLEGAWDFTISYSLVLSLPLGRGTIAGPPPTAPGEASTPTGQVSFNDALQEQLGLKLESHKRPESVLVIDHLEEHPTEN